MNVVNIFVRIVQNRAMRFHHVVNQNEMRKTKKKTKNLAHPSFVNADQGRNLNTFTEPWCENESETQPAAKEKK